MIFTEMLRQWQASWDEEAVGDVNKEHYYAFCTNYLDIKMKNISLPGANKRRKSWEQRTSEFLIKSQTGQG